MTFLRRCRQKWAVLSLWKCGLKQAVIFYLYLFIIFSNTVWAESPSPSPQVKMKILPLITFYNSIGEGDVYNWWAEKNSDAEMKKISQKIFQELAGNTYPKWEYARPEELKSEIKTEWRKTALSHTEMRSLAQSKAAGLILSGDFRFSRSPLGEDGCRIILKFEALRTLTGEKVSEILRIYDLRKWEYDRLLGNQIWDENPILRGAFSTFHDELENYQKPLQKKPLRLIVSGDLTHQQLHRLKARLLQSLKGIKSLQENSYEMEQVLLMVDYEGGDRVQLSQALGQLEFKDFMTQVVSAEDGQVVFDVKAK